MEVEIKKEIVLMEKQIEPIERVKIIKLFLPKSKMSLTE